MNDLRQFGDCLRHEISNRELADFGDFGIEARLANFGRTFRLQEDLARVVEAEIIPRLMLAHREVPDGAQDGAGRQAPAVSGEAVVGSCNILPDADQVAAFADMMLTPAGDDLDRRIAALLESGLAVDSLLLDLLAPTARHLGTLWEEDLCDFVEVTRAMGRLQRIMREITRGFGIDGQVPREGRRILLLPCPGESHSFGLTVVERFFREAGWDVTCTTSEPADDILGRIRNGWFDIVGLSLACEVLLPKLTEAVATLRRQSRNPALRVMVGGPAFTDNPDGYKQVGADAAACDARHALCIAESLLDLSARPC